MGEAEVSGGHLMGHSTPYVQTQGQTNVCTTTKLSDVRDKKKAREESAHGFL